MGLYNLSALSNDFTVAGSIIEINRQAHNIFGIILFIAIFILLWWSMKNFESTRAFAYAGFVTTVLSIIGYSIGFVPMYIPVIFILMTVGAAIMLNSEGG